MKEPSNFVFSLVTQYLLLFFRINIIAEPQRNIINPDNEDQVVFLGDDKPVVIKQGQRSRGTSESKTKLSRSNSQACK